MIGYDSMLKNGIAYLGDNKWSASIMFTDINYQLSAENHQMELVDRGLSSSARLTLSKCCKFPRIHVLAA